MMQDVPRSHLVHLVPVVRQIKTFKTLDPKDPREERNFISNLVGNVLLFLPFPFFCYAFGYRNEKGILAAAFVVSVSIEFIQYYYTIGITDIDDVLLNIAGAYTGLLLLKTIPLPVRSKLLLQ